VKASRSAVTGKISCRYRHGVVLDALIEAFDANILQVSRQSSTVIETYFLLDDLWFNEVVPQLQITAQDLGPRSRSYAFGDNHHLDLPLDGWASDMRL
jgi:hypothetical protein